MLSIEQRTRLTMWSVNVVDRLEKVGSSCMYISSSLPPVSLWDLVSYPPILQSKAPLDAVRIVPPPIHHDCTCGAEENKYKQQVRIECSIQGRTTDVSPLVPKSVSVPIKVEVKERPNQNSRKRARTDITPKGCGTGEEDGRVPEIEFSLGKSSVQ